MAGKILTSRNRNSHATVGLKKLRLIRSLDIIFLNKPCCKFSVWLNNRSHSKSPDTAPKPLPFYFVSHAILSVLDSLSWQNRVSSGQDEN